jgi:hypothetical protein
MRFSRDVTNARIVSRTARRIALRSAQAIEDRANGETNAAWVDEDRAVNRRDAQQQRGRERGSRGARLRYPRDQKRSTEPFAQLIERQPSQAFILSQVRR